MAANSNRRAYVSRWCTLFCIPLGCLANSPRHTPHHVVPRPLDYSLACAPFAALRTCLETRLTGDQAVGMGDAACSCAEPVAPYSPEGFRPLDRKQIGMELNTPGPGGTRLDGSTPTDRIQSLPQNCEWDDDRRSRTRARARVISAPIGAQGLCPPGQSGSGGSMAEAPRDDSLAHDSP